MISISLCMIVKNEEARLAECLDSIAGYVDEIIIVDTGSVDKTKEIALRYTDKVYDYRWTDDFAAARNFSVSKANHEYILSLDGDEIVQSFDQKEICRLIEKFPAKVGRLLCVNEYTRKGNVYHYSERISRLFSKQYYQFEGMIHEQLVRKKPVDREAARLEGQKNIEDRSTDHTYLLPLTVRHSGYEGDLAARRKKTERNITLLKAARKKQPDDPYLLYQLGKSYYMEEDYKTASDYFEQALTFDLNPALEYVQDMVESYGYSLLNSSQYEASLQLLNIYEEFAHSADFVFLTALILMNNGRFQQAIEEFKKAASRKECRMEGVNSYLAFYNIGVIYECLGNLKLAEAYYRKCGDYPAALAQLQKIS